MGEWRPETARFIDVTRLIVVSGPVPVRRVELCFWLLWLCFPAMEAIQGKAFADIVRACREWIGVGQSRDAAFHDGELYTVH